MSQITLDFTPAGFVAGSKKFLKGVAVAALIGAVTGAVAYLKQYHLTQQAVALAAFVPGLSYAVQGVWKWLTTEAGDSAVTIPVPDGEVVNG